MKKFIPIVLNWICAAQSRNQFYFNSHDFIFLFSFMNELMKQCTVKLSIITIITITITIIIIIIIITIIIIIIIIIA